MKKRPASAQPKGRGAIRRWLLRLVILAVALPVLLVVLYKFVSPPFTLLMLDRRFVADAPKKVDKLYHKSIDLQSHSRWVPLAVIAGEDQQFLNHMGLDTEAIRKAMAYNNKHKRKKRGASTISQQTAKNAFLWENRSWVRKGLEIPFTFAIETVWGKERILEVYLNICELGPGVFGFEAASEYWFHKPSKKLSRREAALLAAMLPAPLKGNPRKPSARMAKKAQWIEKQLGFMDTGVTLDALDW